jgi:hypothetical protein
MASLSAANTPEIDERANTVAITRPLIFIVSLLFLPPELTVERHYRIAIRARVSKLA